MSYGDGNELHKLEIAMEAAGVAWWWMELPAGAVFFSPNKARMLDRKPEDFIHYRNFTDLVHKEDYEPMMHAMRSHLEGNADMYEASYRIMGSDGEYRIFYDRGKVVSRKPNGEIILAGVVFNAEVFKGISKLFSE